MDPEQPTNQIPPAEHPETLALVTRKSTVTSLVVEASPAEIESTPRMQLRIKAHHVIAWLVLDRTRSLLSLLAIAVFVLTFIVQPFRIPSESMERTLLVGDFLLVNKSIYGPAGHWGWLLPYREPLRKDIIVFRFPLDAEEHVVKRMIGAAGDRIYMRSGIVYRNNLPLFEPYTVQRQMARKPLQRNNLRDSFRDDFPISQFTDPGVDAHWWATLHRNLVNGELLVPAQNYFVMGDNRNFSRDSRYWGFVPRGNIVGMPMLIYFSVREPSRSDGETSPDDRLGKSDEGRPLDFARWGRTLRIVQ